MGNGYAINAVVGRTEVMQAAQDTFISSTFWTERIGPTAALKALEVMQREDATKRIDAIGRRVLSIWDELGRRNDLSVRTSGLPSLATFSIDGFDPILVKTFVTQEMLKRGFIAGTALYSSIAHTDDVLEQYGNSLDEVFAAIRRFGDDVALRDALDGGPAQSGFQRLA